MEVFMMNLNMAGDRTRVKTEIASIVHGPFFSHFNVGTLLNFEVFVHRPKRRLNLPTTYRTGVVTFPTEEIGMRFLDICGGNTPRIRISVGSKPITFLQGKNIARRAVVEIIRRVPFQDPRELREQEIKLQTLAESSVHLSEIQFGWICRDDVFSVEYAKSLRCELRFSLERREFEISLGDRHELCANIAIRFSDIYYVCASHDSAQASIVFSLYYSPRFEFGQTLAVMEQGPFTAVLSRTPKGTSRRLRMTSLDDDHERVAPYTSVALRVVCTFSDYRLFTHLWATSQVNLAIVQDSHQVEHRAIYTPDALDQLRHWMARLRWPVAFHVDALIRNCVMDPRELLAIRPELERLFRNKGDEYAAGFLRFYREQLGLLWVSERSQAQETTRECLQRCRKEYRHHPLPAADDLFHCLHLYVTPTGMFLDGPYAEQTNRVIRSHPDNKDHFVHVTFAEEDHSRLRFDDRVDGRSFINKHVGSVLRNGLTIGGRQFEFLHYSQSALKDRSVWFIHPFYNAASKSLVNAKSIIDGLGSFNNLSFDKRLLHCPARYAARISQAFTTTDSSITIEPEEIFVGEDITNDAGSCFTDGIGTVSPILAEEMWKLLCAKKRRRFRCDRPRPRAFQIRFQGSKGMISVDYRHKGRELVIRPSMIKFEAATNEIEIASVFNRPGKMYLNRPLIMVLEALGVPGDNFLELQRKAVENVMNAVGSLESTAKILETYGLGHSFRLPSVLRNLAKLVPPCMPTDSFYAKVIQNAVFHILRGFKHHARIPVSGWTLVGVADVHSYLEEGEVFICVEETKGSVKYLEGTVSISRSPTIHAGDVQLARAIGPPPAGSPFLREALQNTVVFSTKGKRSLPSCLGGGDLDGDLYNITGCPDLLPRRTHEAASYDPAPRKELDHPSTAEDVIDFVVDYINADNVGIIATNWLIIADQSDLGIHDPDCLTLAKLHSDAVDYPKTGNAVPMDSVLRPHFSARPDWIEPEIGRGLGPGSMQYYPSERAIGKLYRDIDLWETSLEGMLEHSGTDHLTAAVQRLSLSAETDHDVLNTCDPIWQAVKSKVLEFTNELSVSEAQSAFIGDIFREFSGQLRYICSTNTLSSKRHSRLTEAEAFIGTIKARTSQRKRRKNLIAKLREHTAQLVTDVKYELAGDDDVDKLDRLRMTWASWQLATEKMKQESFGAPSFFWVALNSLFDAIKAIEREEEEDIS